MQKASQGECLQCGKDLSGEPRVRRGLCAKCYQRSRREIGQGRFGELVRDGLMLPDTVGGRPPSRTALDDFIAKHGGREANQEAIAQELVDAHEELESEEKPPNNRDKRRDRKKTDTP